MKHYRAHLLVCAGTGCVSCGSFKIKEALEKEIKKKGLAGRDPGRGHGLQRLLRAGPDRPGPAGRHLLPAPQGRGRAPSRRGAPPQGPPGQEADVRSAGGEEARPEDEGHRVLQAPAADRPPQPRPDRPGEDRGIHRLRRLRGPGQGPDRDDAPRHHRRDPASGPPRPRRGRLPHGQEMGHLRPGKADAEVPHLQRRRGRPRRLHGPLRPRGRPPRRHRRHDHRGQGHRGRQGLHLYPARIPPGPEADGDRHRPGPGQRPPRRGHPGLGVRFRPRDRPGRRAPSSPARRRP